MRGSLCVVILLFSAEAMGAGAIKGKIHCQGTAEKCNGIIFAERTPNSGVPPASNIVVLDQVNLTFVPHVLPVLVGTTVEFPNHDEMPHNVYSVSPAKMFNLGIYPQGASRRVTFDKPGEVVLLCSIHPQMSAYVLVLEQPYFVSSSMDGSFHLQDLPPGKYRITAWHERYKPVSRLVEVKGRETVPLEIGLDERR